MTEDGPINVPTQRYVDAVGLARDLHAGQARKGSTIPYLSHLLGVSSLVIENGGDEDQAIAGLLHDAAEDQGGQATLDEIHKRFGQPVAQIVADCTDSWMEPKPAWRPRKEAHLAALPAKPVTSLLVSLADKVDNAEAVLHDYRHIGDDLWGRFTGGRQGTIWYYQTLATIFARALPCALANELSRTVSQFPDP